MYMSHARSWICGLTLMMPLAAVAGSVSSIISVTGQNGFSQFDFQPFEVSGDTDVLTVNATYDITGPSGVMTYTAEATAQSGYGSLHASYRTAVSNVFFDPSNPAYDPVTGTGAPKAVGGQSNASFTDTITVAGGAALSEVRLVVEMAGHLEQSSASYPFDVGYASLWQRAPDGGSSTIAGSRTNSRPGGDYRKEITTRPFAVEDGMAEINLLLQVYSSWLLEYIDEGEDVSSNIDYSHTASIIGIEGYDSLGNMVDISSAIGESGTTYPVSAVPLPAAVWLFGSCIVGLAGMFGRRRPVA